MRLRNSNTKLDPLQIPLKSRRPLICTTEKYLNNFVPQRGVTPGNQTYANAVATEKKKTCIIGDSHLARITKKEVLEQVKNVTLLFLNVFEALIQSNWTIMLYPHWWMKNQKVLYYILAPMTLLKQIMIMLMQKILVNELLTLRKNVDRLMLTTQQFHPF